MGVYVCGLILLLCSLLAADLSLVSAVNKETQTQLQTSHSGYRHCQFNPPSGGCPSADVCSSKCKICLRGFAIIKSACLLSNNTCDCFGWKVASHHNFSATSNAHARRPAVLHQVLTHPWIIDESVAPEHDSCLKQFSAMNKIKMLRVMEEGLSEEEIGGLKELSKMIDTDNSGTIKFEELKYGLKQLFCELMESEVKDLLAAADIDNSGKIDNGFRETACEQILKTVFKYQEGAHNVLRADGIAFQQCAAPAGTQALTSGNDVVNLTTTAQKWYICGIGQHDASGNMKLAITVRAEGESPAQSPAAGPPYTSAARTNAVSTYYTWIVLILGIIRLAMA